MGSPSTIAKHSETSNASNTSQSRPPHWHDDFVAMLPQIEAHARYAFRRLKGDHREEAVQEAICNCCLAFARLVEQGRAEAATWSSLARYAVAQVRDGRRVGCPRNVKDVTSRHCQQRKAVRVRSLHDWDDEEEQWREVLVEDKRATPADLAASRIDFPAWLQTLSRRDRKIALKLSEGESTSRVARLFRLSSGRVSQLRGELREAWRAFHGEIDARLAEAAA